MQAKILCKVCKRENNPTPAQLKAVTVSINSIFDINTFETQHLIGRQITNKNSCLIFYQ